MAKSGDKKQEKKKLPPVRTPEAREQQMINLAVNLAEEQLRNGTASSQIITHYLKLATTKEQLEKQKLETEVELAKAKTESLKSQKRMEDLYVKAISAMKTYSGHIFDDVEEYEEL